MSNKLFIGRLHRDVAISDLESLVGKFGRTSRVILKAGFAFVDFEDSRDAEDCCKDLNNADFFGERLAVEYAKGSGPRERDGSRDRGGVSRFGAPSRTKFRLLVENLSEQASWQDLKDYFRTAGEVTFADAHQTKRGEGVVDFSTEDEMNAAIRKLDDTEFRGSKIQIDSDDVRGVPVHRPRSPRRDRSPVRRRYSRSRSPAPRRRDRSTSRSYRSRRDSRSPAPRRRDRSDSPRRERRRERSVSPRRKRSESPRRKRSQSPKPRNYSPVPMRVTTSPGKGYYMDR